ncbi:MAG TPA: hypothetical protein VFE82_06655 [Ramlibacter sp.]|jgi:hypothetical protein|uniref:hypothetical protein n=1 Tax=Ramlibacter sp. TaxID=1917967 RepID=UPI002D4B0807|nr:hypothetical protein [Ramlibacter sp.]HZY18146.1 hypothetical protein [Ramlibacter sp.]
MSPRSLDQALLAAIRNAAQFESRPGEGWTIRILSAYADRNVRLGSQAQVARLALELERLGFVLQVDGADDADFVFQQCDMTAATG